MKKFKPYDGEIRVCKVDYVSPDYRIIRFMDIDTKETWENDSPVTTHHKDRLVCIKIYRDRPFFVRFTISNRKNGLGIIDANEFAEYTGFVNI